MKKKRYSRQLIAKLESVDQLFVAHKSNLVFSAATSIAAKVQIDFYRNNNVVAKVIFCDDPAHKQTVIRWYTKQYYALRYGAREAKPINMTLAMWRTFSNR